MGIWDRFRPGAKQAASITRPAAESAGHLFSGLDDPALVDFLRGGETASGAYVSVQKALQNMAILRCVTLISESLGMLPLNLYHAGAEKLLAKEHALYGLLKSKPNQWQTAYEFKALLQSHVLTHGNAYARIIRSRGRIMYLIPIHPDQVVAKQKDDWSVVYRYTRSDGRVFELPAEEVFHLRDLSEDGITGLSRVKLARESIGIALQAERAAARLFKNGVMAGGALMTPNKLSDPAYKNLQDSLDEHTGSDNAHRWLILEEGLKGDRLSNTAVDAQHLENRNHQIEEIARAFGVPRPLLMMDETSWGSGIEQLGIFFVQYSLQHWFTVWEQAVARALLVPDEQEDYYVKFNERALLRGTLKDQAEFFTKALGSGGHSPWMTINEIRELQELSPAGDDSADTLTHPLTQRKPNEPVEPA